MNFRRPSNAALIIVGAALLTYLALDTAIPTSDREQVAPVVAGVTAQPPTDAGTSPWRHVKLIGDRVLILAGRVQDGDATVLKDTGLRRSDLRSPQDIARLQEGINFASDGAVASFLQLD